MRSDKAEPEDSPRQPLIIDKGSARAEPDPAHTAMKPRRSPKTKAGPQIPLMARDKQAKTRTINKQLIGSKRNSAKHASRKRIASLIKTQLTIDKTVPPPTKTSNTTTHKRRITVENLLFADLPRPMPKRQANFHTCNPRRTGATANGSGDHKEHNMEVRWQNVW